MIHLNYFFRKYLRPVFFLIYFILSGFFLSAYGTNHYVDKNANGLNNGTSWATAWNSFSSINWSSIQPGDVIYISGGTDSTVYNETLDIQKSGTAGHLITIRRGQSSGHNGRAVIMGTILE